MPPKRVRKTAPRTDDSNDFIDPLPVATTSVKVTKKPAPKRTRKLKNSNADNVASEDSSGSTSKIGSAENEESEFSNKPCSVCGKVLECSSSAYSEHVVLCLRQTFRAKETVDTSCNAKPILSPRSLAKNTRVTSFFEPKPGVSKETNDENVPNSCPVCSKTFPEGFTTSEELSDHVNACLDKVIVIDNVSGRGGDNVLKEGDLNPEKLVEQCSGSSKAVDVKSKDRLIDFQQEITAHSLKMCPICGKPFKTAGRASLNAATSHLKKCSSKFRIDPDMLAFLVARQRSNSRVATANNAFQLKMDSAAVTSSAKSSVAAKKRKLASVSSEAPDSVESEHLQFAIALSRSITDACEATEEACDNLPPSVIDVLMTSNQHKANAKDAISSTMAPKKRRKAVKRGEPNPKIPIYSPTLARAKLAQILLLRYKITLDDVKSKYFTNCPPDDLVGGKVTEGLSNFWRKHCCALFGDNTTREQEGEASYQAKSDNIHTSENEPSPVTEVNFATEVSLVLQTEVSKTPIPSPAIATDNDVLPSIPAPKTPILAADTVAFSSRLSELAAACYLVVSDSLDDDDESAESNVDEPCSLRLNESSSNNFNDANTQIIGLSCIDNLMDQFTSQTFSPHSTPLVLTLAKPPSDLPTPSTTPVFTQLHELVTIKVSPDVLYGRIRMDTLMSDATGGNCAFKLYDVTALVGYLISGKVFKPESTLPSYKSFLDDLLIPRNDSEIWSLLTSMEEQWESLPVLEVLCQKAIEAEEKNDKTSDRISLQHPSPMVHAIEESVEEQCSLNTKDDSLNGSILENVLNIDDDYKDDDVLSELPTTFNPPRLSKIVCLPPNDKLGTPVNSLKKGFCQSTPLVSDSKPVVHETLPDSPVVLTSSKPTIPVNNGTINLQRASLYEYDNDESEVFIPLAERLKKKTQNVQVAHQQSISQQNSPIKRMVSPQQLNISRSANVSPVKKAQIFDDDDAYPHYSRMETPKLRSSAAKYGIRTKLAKKATIALMKQIHSQLHGTAAPSSAATEKPSKAEPNSLPKDALLTQTQSTASDKASKAYQWYLNFFKGNLDLREKIVLYEPLDFLALWTTISACGDGVSYLSKRSLLNFLDKECIVYQTGDSLPPPNSSKTSSSTNLSQGTSSQNRYKKSKFKKY